MTSSDHHRSSSSAAIEEADADEDEYEYEYEYEYEEIEVEEEIEEEVEADEGIEFEEEEEEEEDPEEEEDEEDPEEEEEELAIDELKEKEEEDPEIEQDDEEASEREEEELEDDEEEEEEEEEQQRAQEETNMDAPNSSIVSPNEANDVSRDLLPKKHDDDFVQWSPVINLETLAPTNSECEVGNMIDDKSSDQQLEKPIRKVELSIDDQSAREDVLMANGCQLEVPAASDRDFDISQTLKIANIGFQENDCSGSSGAKLDKLMDVKDSQVPNTNEKEITSETSLKGVIGGEINPVSESMEIDEQSDIQPVDEISKTASRFSAPLIRSRSVSLETKSNDREKRPAVICEFFAKGWCIKGSACRFLHKRDNPGNTSQILGEETAMQNGGGSRGHGESPSFQDGSGFVTSSRDTVGGVIKQNISSDMPIVSRSNLEVHHNFFEHEHRFRGFGLSMDSHSSNPASYHSSMEQSSLRHCQYLLNDRNASAVGFSMKNSRMPDWRSNFSSNSSFRQDYFAPHKTFTGFNGDDAFRSLLVPSGAVAMERSYHTSIPREPRFSYAFKSKFIPYNWEPSAPFQPSFSVPSLITPTPGCQSDPNRDSIQQAEDTSVKPSSGVELSSHGKSYSSNTDKRQSCSDKKDIPVVEAESASASATGAQAHTSIPKDTECGSNHQKDASRLRIEQKVEKEWQSSEVDLDPAVYEAIHRESKALKHFRAALIEFVKNLLRPMWQDGLLTKDAFKIIVQKAEDKIVRSLPTNQIPASMEQINQYLSLAETKIQKLLEGYAAKYRKSVSSQPVDCRRTEAKKESVRLQVMKIREADQIKSTDKQLVVKLLPMSIVLLAGLSLECIFLYSY
ncbi:hypothetical protein V2J09_018883 [Rumex salicifolius]